MLSNSSCLLPQLPAMIDSYQPGTLHQNTLPSLSSSRYGVLSQQKSESYLSRSLHLGDFARLSLNLYQGSVRLVATANEAALF